MEESQNLRGNMEDWVHHDARRRGGPEWKQQGWMNGLAMSPASAPPIPLLAIFSIVIFLLSLSHSSSYKDRVEHTMIGFRVFAYLLPLALLFLMSSGFRFSRFNLWNQNPRKQASPQKMMIGRREFPWGVAILLLLLVLLMSFHSILWG